MNKRGAGVIFCLIAAILLSTRYIAAAIFMAGGSSWDSNLFSAGLSYVGTTLTTLSVISAIIGIGYLVCAEVFEIYKFK